MDDSGSQGASTTAETASVQCGTSTTEDPSDEESYDVSVNSSGVEVLEAPVAVSTLSVVAPLVPPPTSLLVTSSSKFLSTIISCSREQHL